MKQFLSIILCLLLCSCASSSKSPPPTVPEASDPEHSAIPVESTPPDPIRLMLNQMSLEERVGQLFLARCNANTAPEDIEAYHLAGFVLFAEDFESETKDSMKQKLKQYQETAKIPLLLAVDEEGGPVTRISRFPAFRSSRFPSPRNLYDQGGMDAVLETEAEKASLLSSLGLNVMLGPVCDVTTDPNAFLYQRSLGQSPEVTASYISQTVSLFSNHHIGSCLKHFPGYGNNADTHIGIALDKRTLLSLERNDLIPFAAGIAAGCDAIMVSHTIAEALDFDNPASLSPAVHRYLRQDMGFTGVIITDDLVMQAITDLYGAGEAAVLAILAGNDLLCSTEYNVQYDAVLAAVLDGRIDIDTLNKAVRHVLQWKINLGLI